MSTTLAFAPGTTTAISASGTTANGALTGTGTTVRIDNASGQRAFFKFGIGSTTATTSDTPMEAGVTEVFTRDPNTATNIAVILATGSGTVYATVGEGI